MQELTFEQVDVVSGGNNNESRTERVGRVGGGASLAWEAAGLVRDAARYIRENHERWIDDTARWAERYSDERMREKEDHVGC